MKSTNPILRALVVAALAAAFPVTIDAQSTPAAATHKAVAQRSFASADEAAAALAEAVRAKSVDQLLAVVGPSSRSWLFTGDKVADRNDWNRFLTAYDEKHTLDAQGDAKAILEVGNDAWPFPAPIVKRGSKWVFDTEAGHQEIVNRRVGRNELDAIQTMLAIVDAEREYAQKDLDGNGFEDYAQRFRSTPGKKDGLYWPQEAGDGGESPLGPLVASATSEGYGAQAKGGAKAGQRQPYHGYYYKILKSQGKDAPGGEYDYMVGGKMLGGFAVVAWPARYRSSGVMTFLVNHDGVVYQKDLGAQTASIASHMTRFNPDATWKKAE
ncbi:MAG TPA: DUF2950 domain-containing protein [Usitatibacter sp.]|nr:DUF2950 domain-containing protein [Usitatibacter sp.]